MIKALPLWKKICFPNMHMIRQKTADVLITEIYTIIAVQAVNIRQRSDALCCLG